jgi:hypothetical protein
VDGAAADEQDAELVAADAGDDVGAASSDPQRPRELAQDLVAGGVPGRVVDAPDASALASSSNARVG